MAVKKVPTAPPLLPDTDVFEHFFKHKQFKQPPLDFSPDVEHYIAKVQRDINSIISKPVRNTNLTSDELQALADLRSRRDIVIKPADKGGAVVIWERDLYKQEVLREVGDAAFYNPLPEPSLLADTKTITTTIGQLIRQKSLPPTDKHLNQDNPRQPTFYPLPKIHKPNNPGRPIVSACSCPTVKISQYLDLLLQPIVQNLPTYIKDTTHTLFLLESLNRTAAFHPRLLFTLDVVSLYTSIPHTDGLKALQFFLDCRPINKRYPPTSALVRLAELVLTLNTFEVDGQYFHQTSRVAMGTKMGPSYACLFMGYLEHQVMQAYTAPVPAFYRRFIDDGLGVTCLSLEDLHSFIEFLPNFHPAIKFTFTVSRSCVNFWDISLSISDGVLSTSVFYKETTTHVCIRAF
ncbi:uncharacterized protein [Littorina saxatilis]|uniref:uncharacterized protein n=1 Tax=Littorina saxatilis TaxID=31220 RepID=UPI0038B4D03B